MVMQRSAPGPWICQSWPKAPGALFDAVLGMRSGHYAACVTAWRSGEAMGGIPMERPLALTEGFGHVVD